MIKRRGVKNKEWELHEFPNFLSGNHCDLAGRTPEPLWTMGVALLCLQVLTVLLGSVGRTAATENDVTPRLTFPYSKCRHWLDSASPCYSTRSEDDCGAGVVSSALFTGNETQYDVYNV